MNYEYHLSHGYSTLELSYKIYLWINHCFLRFLIFFNWSTATSSTGWLLLSNVPNILAWSLVWFLQLYLVPTNHNKVQDTLKPITVAWLLLTILINWGNIQTVILRQRCKSSEARYATIIHTYLDSLDLHIWLLMTL